MPFGLDLNAMVDRAASKIGPLLDQALAKVQPIINEAFATATAGLAALDTSIDALTAEQVKTNALLRQILMELRKGT
jgi:hypothetical protein